MTELKTNRPFRSLTVPIYRAATVVFDRSSAVCDDWDQRESGFTYGLYGTPTVLELGDRIAQLEQAYGTLITPGGQSAISLVYLSFLSAGDHVLVPETAYGPSGKLARQLLTRLGIDVEFYPPLLGGEIASRFRDNTRLLWIESPGSITLEVEDVAAMVFAARDHGGIITALDNTYAAGVLFDAFRAGVDVSIQALTKYIGGHGDLLLGSVSAGNREAWKQLGSTLAVIGANVSPDDASLALRGLETLNVRLERIGQTTASIARWLERSGRFEKILCPCLEGSPGHEYWKWDFEGLAGLITLVPHPEIPDDAIHAFVDALRLFPVGYSWGGTSSLAVPAQIASPRTSKLVGRTVVRLSIGLERVDDLVNDLDQAMQHLKKPAALSLRARR